MTGVDIPVLEIQAAVHQPTVKEISYMGEMDFFQAAQTFCFNKEILIAANKDKGNNLLSTMTDFQIFMTLISDQKIQDLQTRQQGMLSFFMLLFPKYKPTILPRSIVFINSEENTSFSLDDDNFSILQGIISQMCCLDRGGSGGGFNPADEKAAEIAQKLMRGRERTATSKGENLNSGILSRYVSILTIGLESMSLNDCLNLTIYQIYDLIERYGLYTSWDLDIKSRLAGGKPDSKPDDWMKNIH